MSLARKVAHKKESDSLVTGNGDRLHNHVLGGTVLSPRFHGGYSVDDIARSRVDVLELKSYIDVFARDADLTTLGASFASKDALAAAFAPVADVFARASRAVFSTPSRDASERDPPRDSPDR